MQVRRESKDHATLSDLYLNNVITRLTHISEDSARLLKRVSPKHADPSFLTRRKEHLVTQLVTRPRRLTAFKGLSGGKKQKKIPKMFSLSALQTDGEAERIRRLHESDRKPKSNKSCNFPHMQREKNES